MRGAGLQLLWVPDSGRRCGSGRAELLGCATPGSSLAIGPHWVAKSSARGRPGVPVALSAEGADPVQTGEGARETPREPRALAPCDPPCLLPGLGLHSLLAETPAVASSESGTKEVKEAEEEKEEEATLGRAVPGRIRPPFHPPTPAPRAGDSRVPQPYHAPGASRALGETETPERVEAILWLLR